MLGGERVLCSFDHALGELGTILRRHGIGPNALKFRTGEAKPWAGSKLYDK